MRETETSDEEKETKGRKRNIGSESEENNSDEEERSEGKKKSRSE